jgi:type II secretory ATPase GspE/PulE/Tfp pilus assembly ATPase PilB-like protein
MAQRLVRKICPRCKIECRPDPKQVPPDLVLAPGEMLYRGEGCEHCRKTGYRGRSGLFELMVMNDTLSQKITQRVPSPEIVAAGRACGLRLLREDGWVKVRQGATTIDEVLKCTAI